MSGLAAMMAEFQANGRADRQQDREPACEPEARGHQHGRAEPHGEPQQHEEHALRPDVHHRLKAQARATPAITASSASPGAMRASHGPSARKQRSDPSRVVSPAGDSANHTGSPGPTRRWRGNGPQRAALRRAR